MAGPVPFLTDLWDASFRAPKFGTDLNLDRSEKLMASNWQPIRYKTILKAPLCRHCIRRKSPVLSTG